MPLRRIITALIVLAYASCLGQSEQSRDSIAIHKRSLEEQRAVAKAAVREVNRLRYLLLANDASRKSLLVQDRELAALVGIQAYNFHSANGGYPFDSSIQEALFNAAKKYGVKTGVGDSTATQPKTVSLNTKEIAEALCKRVTRNLTKEEWDRFFYGFTYERTCDSASSKK